MLTKIHRIPRWKDSIEDSIDYPNGCLVIDNAYEDKPPFRLFMRDGNGWIDLGEISSDGIISNEDLRLRIVTARLGGKV